MVYSPTIFDQVVNVNWPGGLVFVSLELDTEGSSRSMTLTIPGVGVLNVTDDKKTLGDGSVTDGLITKDMLSKLYAWCYTPLTAVNDTPPEGDYDSVNVKNIVVINWRKMAAKYKLTKLEYTIVASASLTDHGGSYSGGYSVSDIGNWGTFSPGTPGPTTYDLWFSDGTSESTSVSVTYAGLAFAGASTLGEASTIATAWEAANPGHTAVISAPSLGVDPYVTHDHRWDRLHYETNVTTYLRDKTATVDAGAMTYNVVDGVEGCTENASDTNVRLDDAAVSEFTAAFSITDDLKTCTVVKTPAP